MRGAAWQHCLHWTMVCINRVALAAPDPKSVLIQTLTLTLIPFVKGSQDSLRHSLLSKIEVQKCDDVMRIEKVSM